MILEYTHTKENIHPVPKAIGASRISWVDHARGLAIMLVVYRHVVVGMKRSGISVSDFMYNLQEVFYNFRMPVFFVLSGIFVAGSLRKKTRVSILEDRAATILYPYLLWAVLTILLQIVFSQFSNSKRNWNELLFIILQPRAIDHLWYLFALFNTSVLYLFFSKIIKKPWIHALLAIFLHAITFAPFLQGNSLISDMLYFYPYFYTGTYLSSAFLNKQKADSMLKADHLKWLLPIFLLGQWFWFVHRDEQKIYFLLFFFINLVACYLVYIISHMISLRNSNDWLAYIGRYSLHIYILHVPIAAFIRNIVKHFDVNMNAWLLLFICWVGGILIPIALFHLLRNFGFEKLFSLKNKSIA